MNWRAIAPLFQGLAAKKIRLAARNAIDDHQGGFPMETPGYFGKVGADVTTRARKGKRRSRAITVPGCALPPPRPLPVSIRSRSAEKRLSPPQWRRIETELHEILTISCHRRTVNQFLGR
jgi:hypothetical protein